MMAAIFAISSRHAYQCEAHETHGLLAVEMKAETMSSQTNRNAAS
jgi:hypothetical protein